MQTYYVLPSATDPSNPPDATRAGALTASLIVGDPSGLVTVYPSVVVMSSNLATVVIPDDTGQATLAEVQTAQANAINAEISKADQITAANTALQTLLTTMTPAIAQGQADLTTLSTATTVDPAIVSRILEGVMTLAQAVADILVTLNLIS